MPFDLRACVLPATGTDLRTAALAAAFVVTVGIVLLRLGRHRRPGVLAGLAVLGSLLIVQPPTADAADHASSALAACQLAPSAEIIAGLPLTTLPLVADDEIDPAATITVELGGFQPRDVVQLIVASVAKVIDADQAGSDGTVRLSGQLPPDAPPGPDELVIYSPATGVGVRQPIVVSNPAAPSTTAVTDDSSSDDPATATTTTTAAPSAPLPPPAPPAAPTTTATTTAPSAPIATTTTLPAGWTPTEIQRVWWRTRTHLSLGDSPFATATPASSTWGSTFSYAVVDAGTTGCTVDPVTGVLAFTAPGLCRVRTTATATSTHLSASQTITFTVHPTPVCAPSPTYSVGDTGPGGGVVFYVSPTCEFWGRYLEIATTSAWTPAAELAWPRPDWCDTSDDVGAYDMSLGAGWFNTQIIMEHCTEGAAVLAQGYRGGGLIDWFLPSEAEQVEVCKFAYGNSPTAVTCTNSGGYINGNPYGFIDHYWSSTEWTHEQGRQTWMHGGHDWRSTDKRSDHVGVRPIRAFGLADPLAAAFTTSTPRSTSRTVTFTLDFSAPVSGLAANDFTNLGTAAGCVFTPSASSGTTVSVQAQCTSDGTLIATLLADSVVHGSGSVGPDHATNSLLVVIDSIAPSNTIVGGPLVVGSGVGVVTDELATAYLVDSSITPASASDITSAAGSLWNSVSIITPGATVSAVSSGLTPGTYRVYVVDLAGNISAPSDPITIRSAQSCSTDCLIGDIGPGGGTVFYDAGSAQPWGRYLEVAPGNWRGGSMRDSDEWPRTQWCNIFDSDIAGATGTAIGTGWDNTQAMLAGCTTGAGVLARSYRGGGFVDWFLPSEMESKALCRYIYGNAPTITTCTNTGEYINGNPLVLTDHYWTSTQVSPTSALQPWLHGSNDYRQTGKNAEHVSTRPIRAFGGADSIMAAITSSVTRSTSRTVDFTIDFSTNVAGLSASDLENAGSAQGCVFTPAASTGTSVAVQAVCTSDGTLIARLKPNTLTAGSVVGPASGINAALVPIDSILPTVAVSGATVVRGTAFPVTLSEPGTLYIVDDSIPISGAASLSAVADAKMNMVTVALESLSDAALHTAGLDAGTYRVYAVDLAGNVSLASSAAFTVRAPQSCTTSCLIGDIGPGGGTVFYAAATPQSWGQYLEVAPGTWRGGSATDNDWPRPAWCNVTNSDITGAIGTAIGTGRANTQAIIAACTSSAAALAAAYQGGGQSDWFLPSIDELVEMCRWVHGVPTGVSTCRSYAWNYVNNDAFTDHYWSSTQVNTTTASQIWMPGNHDLRNSGKDAGHITVRPVRMFGPTAP